MALALTALLISSGLGLLFPLLIVRLLDSLTRTKSLVPLNTSALILISLFIVQAGFYFVESYLLTVIGEHIIYDLRTELFSHLHTLSMEFHNGHRVGDLASRLSNDVTQLRTLLTNNIATFLGHGVSAAGILVIMMFVNARLTLFVVALAPLLVLISRLLGQRIQMMSRSVQDQFAVSATIVNETLHGVKLVKAFGREEHEIKRYGHAMRATFQASTQMAFHNTLFSTLAMFIGLGAIVMVTWYGGYEVVAGRLALPMITGFLIYCIVIANNLAGLASLYGQFRATMGGVQRVFELLDTRSSIKDSVDAFELTKAQGRITFQGVSFGYSDGVEVIRDMTLNIRAGEVIALVGPSGSGKTTLLSLLLRLYDPAIGCIQIDGCDVRNVTLRSLRQQVGIVPQDTLLFGGSIRENILYGRLDASDEDIVSAAKAANAHDFIMELHEQYETKVGERGARLSGGQCQRIGLARAMLMDPRILLLDEATSSLDGESERLVQNAVHRLMRGRTTVIIAHRLSTIHFADRIAVLEKGQIVQLGSHKELMEQGGLYARLYAMQFSNGNEDSRWTAVERSGERVLQRTATKVVC